ncbi:MAG: glycosyltransferase, partial [Ilumatobacter sp.]
MSVGVVICAYTEQRWDQLERAVRSVDRQAVEHELAGVVDHNDRLLERARSRWPEHRVVENRHAPGLSGARNTGVQLLQHRVIAFLDDDAWAHQGWLLRLTEPFSDDAVGLTGGLVEPEWAGARPTWFPDEFLWVVGCSYRGLPTTPADIRNPIGASMAVRREVFERVGLFQDGIGRVGKTPLGCEETELAIRAAGIGYRSRYAPDSIVSHHVGADRTEVSYFVRRCRAEGRSKALVAQLAAPGTALESERSYVAHTIPKALLDCVRPNRGRPVRVAIATMAIIITGCSVAAGSYFAARLQLLVSSRSRQLPSAQRL